MPTPDPKACSTTTQCAQRDYTNDHEFNSFVENAALDQQTSSEFLDRVISVEMAFGQLVRVSSNGEFSRCI